MKRIISILITILLISNIFGSALIASAAEETYEQEPFVDYTALVTGNYDISSTLEHDNYIDINDGVPLYPILEKRNYGINEKINVRFELTATLTGVEIDYESIGFNVQNDISYNIDDNTGCFYYEVVMTYDGITANPHFSFCVMTEEGLTVYAELFGYLSENGLFVSENSYDSAKEASYYYLVETGLITEEEFNGLLQQEHSQKGVETTNVITPTDIMSLPAVSGSTTMATTSAIATTTVAGNIGWTDDNNVWHPMQYNKVEIWDSRYSEKLGTVYTNVSGDYTFSFTDSYSYRNIYIKIYPGGENSIIKTGYGGDYVYTSGTRLNITPGSSVNIGWEVDMSSDLGRAFQISQAINIATKYVKQMNGEYIAPITVKYPHVEDSNSCFYRSWEDTIYIRSSSAPAGYPESYASWDVLMHEYGHHVQAEFGISRNPGGSHSFTQNLADTRKSKDIGIRLAWGEAYASVFSGMAQAYYASSLQNIDTVGDASYTSYNTASLNYEETTKRIGEACEASIIGVLWDLYDTVYETHDTVSFSHGAYWNMITNCDSENLSDFCNYFVDRYSTSNDLNLGKLLSYYKMSPSNLSANTSGVTPSFAWTANGTSSSLQNDKFDLVFFNSSNTEILRIENLSSLSYTLGENEWNTVLNSYGTTYSVVVIGYQMSSPATGGYYSAPLSVAKPTYNGTSSIVQNTSGTTRYSEKTITLTPGSYYDLYVTFGTTGSKLIQTFGTKDTTIELYSASGTLLVDSSETDDDGYSLNAFVRYYTYADTQYIIRVRMWDASNYGTTKIAITPAMGARVSDADTIECYEDIRTFDERTSLTWLSYSQLNYTRVITFEVVETGSYTFEITSEFDTYLYVIDPRSPNELIRYTDFDDDSGEGLNSKLTRTLESGIPYLIIYSGYNIENENHTGDITLTITGN